VRRAAEEPGGPGAGVPLGFSLDGSRVALLRPPDRVEVVDLGTGEVLKSVPVEVPEGRGLPPVAVDEGLGVLVDAGRDGRVRVRDLGGDGGVLRTVDVDRVSDLALSPDGRVLLTRRERGVWEWREGGFGGPGVRQVRGDRVVFAGGSGVLAAFEGRGVVRIWDVAAGSPAGVIQLPEGLSPVGVLSRDGSVLVTVTSPGGVENLIQLWNTRSGELVGSCAGHKQGILSVALSPDGRTLASSSSDSTLRLWNVATQQELLSVQRLADVSRFLAFTPDGARLLGDNAGGPGWGSLRVLMRAPFPAMAAGAGRGRD